ncbi:mitogen-activated protein kinase homolog NTF3 [Tanacetum coccineum]
MLVFDPSKRISVTEALQHPYMSSLYDPRCDPVAHAPVDMDIDEELGEDMIREMMWKEMLHYHPEVLATAMLGFESDLQCTTLVSYPLWWFNN